MAATNKTKKSSPVFTHGGTKAQKVSSVETLRRLVMTHMLWEDTFYVDGESSADLIRKYVKECNTNDVVSIALEAKNQQKLRHVPLFLAKLLAENGRLDASVLDALIQRVDEIPEFLAMYWENGKSPLSRQVKKGLAMAFDKFDEYQFAKYDRKKEITLRDVMRLVHPKPKDSNQSDLFKRIISGELKTPDTWETSLSAGADKKETFTRLIQEGKLGGLAFLRNLRNMIESGVSRDIIKEGFSKVNVSKVLPFTFIAAAKYAPGYEQQLEDLMLKSLSEMPKLVGHTVLLVDVSGSMFGNISHRSQLQRVDAAVGLAILARELCEDVEIFTFSDDLVQVPSRRGFALGDAIVDSQSPGSTKLNLSANNILSAYPNSRLIILTDEQDSGYYNEPLRTGNGLSYMINVASYQNGLGYGNGWNHINGWSESVFNYIQEKESNSW